MGRLLNGRCWGVDWNAKPVLKCEYEEYDESGHWTGRELVAELGNGRRHGAVCAFTSKTKG